MPGQGFWFIATVLVPENAGTKAQLPKIEVNKEALEALCIGGKKRPFQFRCFMMTCGEF